MQRLFRYHIREALRGGAGHHVEKHRRRVHGRPATSARGISHSFDQVMRSGGAQKMTIEERVVRTGKIEGGEECFEMKRKKEMYEGEVVMVLKISLVDNFC